MYASPTSPPRRGPDAGAHAARRAGGGPAPAASALWRLLGCLLALLPVVLALASPVAARSDPVGEIAIADLPPEARQTITAIRRGGPFPYERDGVVFGNRERILPAKPRGYYHEYTVKTPGSRNRGARRIVSGKEGELFYSDDHYASFRRIREKETMR